jgi:hypothetical protein
MSSGCERAPVSVERWPGGGFVVRLGGHPRPVSRHDTEEEANARADAYRRGLAAEARQVSSPA